MAKLLQSGVTMSEEIILLSSDDEEEEIIDLCDEDEEEEGSGKNVANREADDSVICIDEEDVQLNLAIQRSLRDKKSLKNPEEKENQCTGGVSKSSGPSSNMARQNTMLVKPHKVLSSTWANGEKGGSLVSAGCGDKVPSKPISTTPLQGEPPAKKAKVMKVQLTKDTADRRSPVTEEPCPPLKKCFVSLVRTDVPKHVELEQDIKENGVTGINVKNKNRNLWTNLADSLSSTSFEKCIQAHPCRMSASEAEEHGRPQPASPAPSDSSVFSDELPDLDIELEMIIEKPAPYISLKESSSKDRFSPSSTTYTCIKKENKKIENSGIQKKLRISPSNKAVEIEDGHRKHIYNGNQYYSSRNWASIVSVNGCKREASSPVLSSKSMPCIQRDKDKTDRHFTDLFMEAEILGAPTSDSFKSRSESLSSLESVELYKDIKTDEDWVMHNSVEIMDSFEKSKWRRSRSCDSRDSVDSLESVQVYNPDGSMTNNSDDSLEEIELPKLTRSGSQESLESVLLYGSEGKINVVEGTSSSAVIQTGSEQSVTPTTSLPRHGMLREIKSKTRNPKCLKIQDRTGSVNECPAKLRQRQESGESRTLHRKINKRQPCLVSVPFHGSIVFSDVDTDDQVQVAEVHEFTETQVNTIEACQEEGPEFVDQVTALLQDFTNSLQEPPIDLLKYILTDVLLKCNNRVQMYNAYSALKHVQNLCPSNSDVPFDWDIIEEIVGNIKLPFGLRNCEPLKAAANILALQYIVSVLEEDLLQRPLGKQKEIHRSAAWRLLSADLNSNRSKTIVQWIASGVTFGQCELQKSFSKLQLSPVKTPVKANQGGKRQTKTVADTPMMPRDLPLVVPLFIKLLELSLVVSRDTEERSRCVALELARMYLYLPSLHHRRVLLSSIQCPVLQLKLSQRILEDHCDNANFGCSSGPVHLEDIVMCYFTSEPPRNSFTPPPTPDDDDDGDEDVDISDNMVKLSSHENNTLGFNGDSPSKYSQESCEELAMLVCSAVEAYIQYAKGKLYQPLGRRFLEGTSLRNGKLDTSDLQTLSHFDHHISRFKSWLEGLCSDLSMQTNLYIARLQCLGSLAEIGA